MSLQRRVECLERRTPVLNSAGESHRTEHQRVQMKVLLNAMAEARGETVEPLTEEERRTDLENERHWLEDGIPALRRAPGWDTPEALELLEGMEEAARQSLRGEVPM